MLDDDKKPWKSLGCLFLNSGPNPSVDVTKDMRKGHHKRKEKSLIIHLLIKKRNVVSRKRVDQGLL